MEYGAIDLYNKENQIRIGTERDEVLDRRIATTRDRVATLFEGGRPMRIRHQLDASQHSENIPPVHPAHPSNLPIRCGLRSEVETSVVCLLDGSAVDTRRHRTAQATVELLGYTQGAVQPMDIEKEAQECLQREWNLLGRRALRGGYIRNYCSLDSA